MADLRECGTGGLCTRAGRGASKGSGKQRDRAGWACRCRLWEQPAAAPALLSTRLRAGQRSLTFMGSKKTCRGAIKTGHPCAIKTGILRPPPCGLAQAG